MAFPRPFTQKVTVWDNQPDAGGAVLQSNLDVRQLKPFIPLWEREFDYFAGGFIHRWCLGPDFAAPKTGIAIAWGGTNWNLHFTLDAQRELGYLWWYRIQSIECICLDDEIDYWYALMVRLSVV